MHKTLLLLFILHPKNTVILGANAGGQTARNIKK